MSWDDGFPGARASRPHQAFPGARASRHQAWHSLGHLPHLDQPGTAPARYFGLADGVPADRVAALRHCTKAQGSQQGQQRVGLRRGSRARAMFPPWVAACGNCSEKGSAAAKGSGRDARAPQARRFPPAQPCSIALSAAAKGINGRERRHVCPQNRADGRFPLNRVAACGIALKLSGSQRDSMRAGRPRSQARQKPGSWFTPFINALIIPFVGPSSSWISFFCLRHGLATSLPTEPAGCGASG